MKITVVGAGYVGLSIACLLAQRHEIRVVDVVAEKVDMINNAQSPIVDSLISDFLDSGELNLRATCEFGSACADADFVVVATPTNYDDEHDHFDTSAVESVVEEVAAKNPHAVVVIKSTVPVGFTQTMSERHPGMVLLFSPEFLREGRALYDNVHPSRIIVGCPVRDEGHSAAAERFADLLVEGAAQRNPEARDTARLITRASEAEAVKLFANTYLALRVSFFNELDTYAESKGLDTRQIIEGVCLDPRIGNHYNNPSFGYGGYCLPKDSKQLLANYDDVPQNLIRAIVESNETRKRFVADRILERNPNHVGVFRLIMKDGSDNFRESSVQGVMRHLRDKGVSLLIYEPMIQAGYWEGWEVMHDLRSFKESCDIIMTNRFSDELLDVADKVVTRDLWHRD